jgi:hypothetical protein
MLPGTSKPLVRLVIQEKNKREKYVCVPDEAAWGDNKAAASSLRLRINERSASADECTVDNPDFIFDYVSQPFRKSCYKK